MPILSNIINAAGGNVQYAQLSLSATTTLSPLLKPNDWSNLQFNIISVPNTNVISSITPSTSSFNLIAGTYKFNLYTNERIDAGAPSRTVFRCYNNTTATALTPNSLAYDWQNSPADSLENYTTIPLFGFSLSQNSNVTLQVYTERADANLVYGVIWPTGTYSTGYLLDIYKIA